VWGNLTGKIGNQGQRLSFKVSQSYQLFKVSRGKANFNLARKQLAKSLRDIVYVNVRIAQNIHRGIQLTPFVGFQRAIIT
jgi:hypothetical protein